MPCLLAERWIGDGARHSGEHERQSAVVVDVGAYGRQIRRARGGWRSGFAHLVGTFANVAGVARALPAAVLGTVLACGFLLALLLAPDTGGAFIYFQF
jgi:hypothetical protein